MTGAVGQGVSYRGGPSSLLSEGGLLLATTPTRGADHLRGTAGAVRQSFFELMQVARIAPGPPRRPGGPRHVSRLAARPRSTRARWACGCASAAKAGPRPTARRGVILLDYSLLNLTADTLQPLYAGNFYRLGPAWHARPQRGPLGFGEPRELRLRLPRPPRVYAGVQVLGPGPAGAYAIDNAAPAGAPIYLGDGFSPAEKFLALSGGFGSAHRQVGTDTAGTDVSQVVSTRIPQLAPGDSATVTFAVLAADSLAGLHAAAQAATAAYQQVLATARPAAPPGWQLYPNPAQGQVHVRMPASVGAAVVQVFDSQGRLVSKAALPPGGGAVALAALPPGLYVVRVLGAGGSWAQRISHE